METFPISRGYDHGGYHQLAYPVLPFLDPIVILAAFSFIAYLIQTFHTLYLTHRSTAPAANPGLLGTVVEGLVPSRPTRLRDNMDNDEQVRDILSAINLYKENRERLENTQDKNNNLTDINENILVPISTKNNIL